MPSNSFGEAFVQRTKRYLGNGSKNTKQEKGFLIAVEMVAAYWQDEDAQTNLYIQ